MASEKAHRTVKPTPVRKRVGPCVQFKAVCVTVDRFVGSAAHRDQPINEMADSEIPSPEDGVIFDLLVESAATFALDTVLGKILVGSGTEFGV